MKFALADEYFVNSFSSIRNPYIHKKDVTQLCNTFFYVTSYLFGKRPFLFVTPMM